MNMSNRFTEFDFWRKQQKLVMSQAGSRDETNSLIKQAKVEAENQRVYDQPCELSKEKLETVYEANIFLRELNIFVGNTANRFSK